MAVELLDRRVILLDLDAFFVSVEELRDPSLRGKPVVVGGSPEGRGVVAAASYAAREYGVHSAMPMRAAVKLCPHLIILPSSRGDYSETSRMVMALLAEYAPLVEQVSIDEAYVELPAGIPFYRAGEIGRDVQRRIQGDIGLPSSVGVATSKVVAKIACEMSKPQGFLAVPPGQEAEFLAPLPVRRLPGIGPRSGATLHEHGLETLGQLTATSDDFLARLFGKRGPEMRRRARGVDGTPVVVQREAKSRSVERTFSRDIAAAEALLESIRHMSEDVAGQLRKEGVTARAIGIKLRYSDFTTLTRSHTRPEPTDAADAIYEDAAVLFERAWEPLRPVRLLGVKADKLSLAEQPERAPRLL